METFLSCSQRADRAEDQAKNLQVAEFLRRGNNQFKEIYFAKIKALIGKKWNPETHHLKPLNLLIVLNS